MGKQWTKEQAWEWYNSRPWIRGFNYIAYGAVNRIEQWQEFEHDRIEQCFREEIKLAHDYGFNAVRSILPYEVWGRQHDTFMEYLETYLTICAENEIGVMLCFGNDCTVPMEEYKLPELVRRRLTWVTMVVWHVPRTMCLLLTASLLLMFPNMRSISARW